MKAMLEARIVAARIHGRAWTTQGWSAFAERSMASSHGVLMKAAKAGRRGEIVSEVSIAILTRAWQQVRPIVQGPCGPICPEWPRLCRCSGRIPGVRCWVTAAFAHRHT